MKEQTFYVGLTLILISFTACVLSLYLLVFGIPFFLAGAILVFLSSKTLKTKILLTLIPILLFVPTTFSFLFLYNYSAPKIILFPKGFEGTLRIVYEERCGKSYNETDGKKTLIFPENGILILKEDFDRHVNYHCYSIDEFGNRTEVNEILQFNDTVRSRPCVLFGSSGSIAQQIETDLINQERKEIKFSDLYIYNTDTIKDEDFKSQERLDSITINIVNKCRQNL